jgi:hypothetical protein
LHHYIKDLAEMKDKAENFLRSDGFASMAGKKMPEDATIMIETRVDPLLVGGRCLHSSTFRLNVSTFCCVGGV